MSFDSTTKKKKKGDSKKRFRDRLGRLVAGGRAECDYRAVSSMVLFASELSLRGVFRGLPVEPLDATAVDAGVEALLGSGALV